MEPLAPRGPRDHRPQVPRSRFQSARALADDLERFLEDRPIAARRPGILHRASKWARRHRILVGAAAAVLFTVAIAGVITRDARLEAARTEYAERLRAALAELETLRLYFPQHGSDEGYSYRLRWQQYSMFVAFRPEDYDGRVSRLRSELEALWDLLPDRPDAPYHLARIESELGRTERALQVCEDILARHPDFVAADAVMDELRGVAPPAKRAEVKRDTVVETWAQHWLAARQSAARRDWTGAVESWKVLCDQALSGTPEPYVGMSYEALLSRGRARLELEDWAGAADDFATAVGFLAEALPTRLYHVQAHLRAKRLADARRIAEEAFRHLRQKDETAYWLSTLHEGSAIQEARFWAQKIEDEGVREALMVLILITLREYPAAIKAGERGWALRPSDMAIASATIVAALDLGRLEYARKILSRMIAREPDHTETLNARGHVALWTNRPQEALNLATFGPCPHLGRSLYVWPRAIFAGDIEVEVVARLPAVGKLFVFAHGDNRSGGYRGALFPDGRLELGRLDYRSESTIAATTYVPEMAALAGAASVHLRLRTAGDEVALAAWAEGSMTHEDRIQVADGTFRSGNAGAGVKEPARRWSSRG